MQSGNTYFVKFDTQVWIRFLEPSGTREIVFTRVPYDGKDTESWKRACNQAQYITSALTEYESGINTRWTSKQVQGFVTVNDGYLIIGALGDILNDNPVAVLDVKNGSNNEVSTARFALEQAGFTEYMHSSSIDFPEDCGVSQEGLDSLLHTLGIR